MKNNFLPKVVVALVVVLPNIVIAGNADYVYENCKSRADQKYRDCSASEEKCDRWHDQAYDRCLDQYKVNRDTNTNAYDASGRFTPIPIPQRPAYVMPGMR